MKTQMCISQGFLENCDTFMINRVLDVVIKQRLILVMQAGPCRPGPRTAHHDLGRAGQHSTAQMGRPLWAMPSTARNGHLAALQARQLFIYFLKLF